MAAAKPFKLYVIGLSDSYESSSTSVPVSEFVGERPLSPECNRFSIG